MIIFIIIIIIIIGITCYYCFKNFSKRDEQYKTSFKIKPEIFGNDKSKVYKFKNFLTHKECNKIIQKSKGKFTKSSITTYATEKDKEFRVSETYNFPSNDPFLMSIDKKIAEFLNIPLEYSEETQVQYYEKGGIFKPHTDSFDPKYKEEWDNYAGPHHGGNRTWTFTVYLNDVGKDNGGHTTFTKLNFSVRPEKGMAIAWHNLNDDGTPNPEMEHEGSRILKGTKYIITKWFRQNKYREV